MSAAESEPGPEEAAGARTETAAFGGGCFWCVEAVFERVEGVISATSGYQGGTLRDPDYKQVCGGDTGHAEVVRVTFDPDKVTYEELLEVFWKAHDPTQLNRQGADVGTQYRSVIFYYNEEQKKAAEASKKALEASGKYRDPVVTEIVNASEFYEAEAYHQDFYRKNPKAPYSLFNIKGKLKKLGLERDVPHR
jgi:peptide-methionine (S)-S-oxide reductase